MKLLIICDDKWSSRAAELSSCSMFGTHQIHCVTAENLLDETVYDLYVIDERFLINAEQFPNTLKRIEDQPFFVIVQDGSQYLELEKKPQYLGYLDFEANKASIASLILKALTQIHQAAPALEETTMLSFTESNNHAIFDTFPVGIVFQNHLGQITDMNREAENILEATMSQLMGVTSMDPRWQTVDVNGRPLDGADHPAMITLRTKKRVDNFIMGVYSSRHSRIKWIRIFSVPCFDELSNIKMVYSCFIDISEEISHSQRLNIYSSVFQHSPISMLITDCDGVIESVNPKLVELTGYQQSELLGQKVNLFTHKESSTDYKALWSTILGGQVWKGEFKNQKKTGDIYTEEAIIAPIKNKNKQITHFVAIKEDVTEQRKVKIELDETLKHLEKMVEKRTSALVEAQTTTLEALSTLSELRDNETGLHIQRTKFFMKLILEELVHRSGLNADEAAKMWDSGPLHDIGKVAIRDEILLKPGPLTIDEFRKMKEHVHFGYQALCLATHERRSNEDYLKYAKEIALYHHEKWDGSGYPYGIKGVEIPLSARVMAIADVYDALRSKRPYKSALSHQATIKLMEKEKGRHFDPFLVEIFLSIHHRFDDIFEQLKDE